MKPSYILVRSKLDRWGLWPTSRVAWGAWYALGMALFLLLLQKLVVISKFSAGTSLGWWVGFLSSIAIVLFTVLAFRWLKVKLLWRLRNRLIVTYVFIGVVPTLLLVAMVFATLYLFAGQFANFIVTSEIHLHLHSVEAVNSAMAQDLAAQLQRGQTPVVELLDNLRKSEVIWKHREVCAWQGSRPLPICGDGKGGTPFAFPGFVRGRFSEIVRDHDGLYLRTATVLPVHSEKLTVVSSEALDQDLLQEIAANLGEITLYTIGLEMPESSNSSAAGKSGDAPMSSSPGTSPLPGSEKHDRRGSACDRQRRSIACCG